MILRLLADEGELLHGHRGGLRTWTFFLHRSFVGWRGPWLLSLLPRSKRYHEPERGRLDFHAGAQQHSLAFPWTLADMANISVLFLTTADLHSLVVKLRHSFHITGDGLPLTRKEQEEQETFQNICSEAMKVAEELLERLDRLRVKGGKHQK